MEPCIWDIAPQGSDGWLKARIGKLTASRMADAMATTKKGESEARRKLRRILLAERLTGNAMDTFVTTAMMWGQTYEAEARRRFEETKGLGVELCGFAYMRDYPNIGASPDGLVGKNSLLELKCPNTDTHLGYLEEDKVPDKYKPQMLLQLIVTGRDRCHFGTYDPRLPDFCNFRTWIYEPTAEEREEALSAAIQFLKEVDALEEQLRGVGF